MLFVSTNLVGQSDTLSLTFFKHIIKDETDGFKINETNDAYFDKNNRLWISGIYYNNALNQLQKPTPILQSYDGNKFDEIQIPTGVIDDFDFIKMVKREDAQFYILISGDNYNFLYLFNPDTLKFTELKIPSVVDFTVQTTNIFEFQNQFIVFIESENSIISYTLTNSLEWKFLNKTVHTKLLRDAKFTYFNDHFMLSFKGNGIRLFNLDGSLIKQVKHADLYDYYLDSSDNMPFINQVLKYNGLTYTRVSDRNFFQRYDPISKNWSNSKIYINNAENNKSIFRDRTFNDVHGNLLYNKWENSEATFSIFIDDLENPVHVTEVKGHRMPTTVSRNLEKEVIITDQKKLHHIIFKSKNISSFLKEKSIRGIIEINKDEFLIATEKSGWFVLNSKNQKVLSYDMTFNGLRYLPLLNRKILKGTLKDNDGYWSNDEDGLIFVDSKTKRISAFPKTTRIAAMTDDVFYIYCGTWDGKVIKFNKKTFVTSLVASADNSLEFQDIIVKNKVIYAATTKGLLICSESEYKLIKPVDKGAGSYLLSLLNHPEYGILIGNKTGEIFNYNEDLETFEIFYKDELNSSIASMLNDQHGNIWINTFAGIVAFDPKDNNHVRFTSEDGLSDSEANRYSAFKASTDHFLVGSVSGINYFHPDSLYKEQLNVELEFTSAQYYNNKKKSLVHLLSHKSLHDFKEVVLPPENRNMNLNIGLLGFLSNPEVYYRYRLNNEEWVDLGLNYEINFINLSPGDYKLEVEARDNIGNKLGNSLFLNIISKDFFINTKWFYMILILVILTFIMIYISFSNTKHKKQVVFSQDLIKMQEEERHRIALELHDGVAQQLTLLARESKNLDEQRFSTMAMKSLDNLRAVSRGLAPAELEEFGLTLGLTDMINEVDEQTDIFFTVDIDPVDSVLDKTTALHIYRITQELLTNIVKHSRAKKVKINLKSNSNRIKLTVKDDGLGFNVHDLKLFSKSLGMRSIKERCNIINAKIVVNSAKGKGTETVIAFPIPVN
jgi:signal transduction histidine kinase